MPKKKDETVQETVHEDKEEITRTQSAQDSQIQDTSTDSETPNPRQEAADREASEFLGETVKNGQIVEKETENKVEKKAKATAKESKAKSDTKEIVKEDEGVDFDPDKFKADIVAELDKRIPGTKQEKEEVKEKKDALEEYLAKAKAEGRNPTWSEAIRVVAEIGSNQAYERIKAEQAAEKAKADEEAKTQQETAAAVQKQQEEYQAYLNKNIDEDLSDLYSLGKLTRIQNPEDPNDSGVKQRKALFQAMFDLNTKRAAEGKRPVTSVKEVYYEHFEDPLKQPAGANAPVSIGKGSIAPDDNSKYSYWDIHGTPNRPKDFVDIARGR